MSEKSNSVSVDPPKRPGHVCHNCRKPGHIAAECKEQVRKNVPFCNYCKTEGHLIPECPVIAEQHCNYCKQSGHKIPRCPALEGRRRTPEEQQQSRAQRKDTPEIPAETPELAPAITKVIKGAWAQAAAKSEKK